MQNIKNNFSTRNLLRSGEHIHLFGTPQMKPVSAGSFENYNEAGSKQFQHQSFLAQWLPIPEYPPMRNQRDWKTWNLSLFHGIEYEWNGARRLTNHVQAIKRQTTMLLYVKTVACSAPE